MAENSTAGDSEAAKVSGLSAEEAVVYKAIAEERNKGIWIKDIRVRSNLQQNLLQKILKTLETRKLIKSVKAVGAANRKMYMLFHIEPSKDLTGGAWYNESGEFDSNFIDVLKEAIFSFIKKGKGWSTLTEVHEFIHSAGISKVPLQKDDVLCILNVLVFDGRLEEMDDPRAKKASLSEAATIFKVSRIGRLPIPFIQVPCSVCPARHRRPNDMSFRTKTTVTLLQAYYVAFGHNIDIDDPTI